MNKRAVKNAAKRFIWTGGAGLVGASGLPRLRRLPEREGSLRILMYHKIDDQPDNPLSVSLEAFRAQQRYLKEHYCVVALDDVLAHLEQGAPLPRRAVLLTFDDGYRDNYLAAYPILKELGHRAVLFAPIDFIGQSRPLPHDEQLAAANPTLSWDDLRRMQDVFEIGSHACSHRSLPSLPLSVAASEIVRSRQVLEERLGAGSEVRSFSYIKGEWSLPLEEVVQRAGYRIAFITVPGTNLPSMHRFRLKRYNVEDYGPGYFARLLDGSADFLALKDTGVGSRIKGFLNGVLVGHK